jgi:hypothetical protein
VAPRVNVKKDKKVRKTITVQVKQEIVENNERDVKTCVLVTEYNLPQSTILNITGIQYKDKFKALNVNDALTRIFKGK